MQFPWLECLLEKLLRVNLIVQYNLWYYRKMSQEGNLPGSEAYGGRTPVYYCGYCQEPPNVDAASQVAVWYLIGNVLDDKL